MGELPRLCIVHEKHAVCGCIADLPASRQRESSQVYTGQGHHGKVGGLLSELKISRDLGRGGRAGRYTHVLGHTRTAGELLGPDPGSSNQYIVQVEQAGCAVAGQKSGLWWVDPGRARNNSNTNVVLRKRVQA